MIARKGGLLGGTDLKSHQGDVNSTGFLIPTHKAKEYGEVVFVGGSDGEHVPVNDKPLLSNDQVIKAFRSGGDLF